LPKLKQKGRAKRREREGGDSGTTASTGQRTSGSKEGRQSSRKLIQGGKFQEEKFQGKNEQGKGGRGGNCVDEK